MTRVPDLRFRVNGRSAFGRRLETLDNKHRKVFFDAVVDAGVRAIESAPRRDTCCDQLEKAVVLLEGLHERWERFEAHLGHVSNQLGAVSRGQAMNAASTLPSFSDGQITDIDLTTLIGTLGRWGSDARIHQAPDPIVELAQNIEISSRLGMPK